MMPLSARGKQIRRDVIDLQMANGGYHYGGSFSCVEILSVLYDTILRSEDRFVLSKGHACWPLYVILRERGLKPRLEGHPVRDEANGICYTTGSLGHGFPAAVGMAMARKQLNLPGRIYVLMGDGECQEGTTWEALLTAAHRKLDNLTVIVDANGLTGSAPIESMLSGTAKLGDVALALGGWSVEWIDGHNENFITRALVTKDESKPRLIIAETVKGCGVSFMEGVASWHSRYPTPDERAQMEMELA